MADVYCKRCDLEAPAPADVPYGGKVGEEIRENTCGDCWDEWLKMEVMVINELRLNFMDPKSRDVLGQHMKEFLKLTETSPEMAQRFAELDEKAE